MFHVDDHVQIRRWLDSKDYSREGIVVSINGKWITVRHDRGNPKMTGRMAVPPRFDYQADDLQHIDPLLKFVSEF